MSDQQMWCLKYVQKKLHERENSSSETGIINAIPN